MQVHLDIEDGRKAGSGLAHVGEFWCLVDGECVGASKLDEEQVVLNEVVTKCRFGKQTLVCHPVGEGMLGVRRATSADAAAFRRSKKPCAPARFARPSALSPSTFEMSATFKLLMPAYAFTD